MGVRLPVWDTEIAFGYIWGTPDHQSLNVAQQQEAIARLTLVALASGVQRNYFYAWGNTHESIQLVTRANGISTLTPAGITADMLGRRLLGARLMYCENGDSGQAGLVPGEWQCAFDNGILGSSHEYTLARWSTTYARQIIPGPGAALLTTTGGAVYGLSPSTALTINGRPLLITYRTGPTAAALGRLPARTAAPTVSFGDGTGVAVAGTTRAFGGFVRSAGSGLGVPGAVAQLWRRPLGSAAPYAYAAGGTTYSNGYYGFNVELSTSSEYQMRFGGTRTELPVIPATLRLSVAANVAARTPMWSTTYGRPLTISGSVWPDKHYQTVWLQRWTGTAWATVATTRLSGTSTVTFAVAPVGRSAYCYRIVKPYTDPLNSPGASGHVYLHWT